MIVGLVSTGLLNLFKDSLTLIGLLSVMFYQNWKLSLIAIIMIPFASIVARVLGKRIGKVATQQMQRHGTLSSYLIEIFKTFLQNSLPKVNWLKTNLISKALSNEFSI